MYADILDKIPVGVIIFDENIEIVSINNEGEKYLDRCRFGLMDVLGNLAQDTLAHNQSLEKIIEYNKLHHLFIWRVTTEVLKSYNSQVMINIEDKTCDFIQGQSLLKAEKLAVAGQLAIGSLLEIRNPLTSAKGFCQLMKEKAAIQEYYIDIVADELEQIRDIIEQFHCAVDLTPKKLFDDLHHKIRQLSRCLNDDHVMIMVSDPNHYMVVEYSEEQIIEVVQSILSNIGAEEGICIFNFETIDSVCCLRIKIIAEEESGFFWSNIIMSLKLLHNRNTSISVQIVDRQSIEIIIYFQALCSRTGT